MTADLAGAIGCRPMPDITLPQAPAGPRLWLPVPLLTAANVLVWVVVSLQLAHSLA